MPVQSTVTNGFVRGLNLSFQRAQEALYIARQTSSRCFPLCRNKLPIQEQEKNDLPEILDVLA